MYLALDEQDGIKPFEKPADELSLLATDEGRLAASLVHDFLLSCNLKFTLSVLEPEGPLAEPLSRGELCSRLGLEQRQGPLLLQLLHPLHPPATSQSPEASNAKVRQPEPVSQDKAADIVQAKDEPPEVALGGASRGGSRLPPLSGPKALPSLEPQAVLHLEAEPHSLQSTASRKTDHSGSEESVEEELSRMDDSSLSTTADDRTFDLTVSRASDVEGCDYAEPAH